MYSTGVQQHRRISPRESDRHLASELRDKVVSEGVPVVRDEEVVGSNPATPTVVSQVKDLVLMIESQVLDRFTVI